MNIQAIDVKAPAMPANLVDTGLRMVMLRDIFLKTIFRRHLNTTSDIAAAICLPIQVTQALVELAREQKLIEAMGNRGASTSAEMIYELSETGKTRALDALAQSEYYGPMPVPLDDYKMQTERQSIGDVNITKQAITESMAHLVLPKGFLDQLGPAINSGKSILMYGPPGNGKSSISNAIRDALGDKIYVPYCIEYAGQVISVYDPIVHDAVLDNPDDPTALRLGGNRHDRRYILCNRPTVMTGGELMLDMLDLNYNAVSRTYQASLQLKSTGGVFIVDDLGRQEESPQALINRWIVPMESGFDILALQSGEKFVVPFDTLVIFSTNFQPLEMFDGAALRRIAYKVKVNGPNQDEFLQIFMRVCSAKGMKMDENTVIHLLKNKYPQVNNEFANFHSPFLIEQIQSICDYERQPHHMTPALIDRAWENLFVKED